MKYGNINNSLVCMVAEGKMGSERKIVCSWMKFSTLLPIFELVSTLNSSSQTVWLIYSLWFRSVCSEWYRQCVTISTCIVNSLKLKTISTPEFPEQYSQQFQGYVCTIHAIKIFFTCLELSGFNGTRTIRIVTLKCTPPLLDVVPQRLKLVDIYGPTHISVKHTWEKKTTRKKHAYMYT